MGGEVSSDIGKPDLLPPLRLSQASLIVTSAYPLLVPSHPCTSFPSSIALYAYADHALKTRLPPLIVYNQVRLRKASFLLLIHYA